MIDYWTHQTKKTTMIDGTRRFHAVMLGISLYDPAESNDLTTVVYNNDNDNSTINEKKWQEITVISMKLYTTVK